MAIVSFSLFCLRKSSTVRKALLFALCFLSYTSLPCLSTLGTYGLRSCYGPVLLSRWESSAPGLRLHWESFASMLVPHRSNQDTNY